MTEEVRPKTLTLEVKDRLIILDILPQQSNFVDQLLSRDIRTKVELSQAEATEAGIRTEGQQIMWKEDTTLTKDIEFTEAELNLLTRMVRLANDEQRVTRFMLDTFLKLQRFTSV